MRFHVLGPDEDPYHPSLPWTLFGLEPWHLVMLCGAAVIILWIVFRPAPPAQADPGVTSTATVDISVTPTETVTVPGTATPGPTQTPTPSQSPTRTTIPATQTPWIQQVEITKIVWRDGPAVQVTRLAVTEIVRQETVIVTQMVVVIEPPMYDTATPVATQTPWIIIVTQPVEVTREITVVVTPTETPTPTETITETPSELVTESPSETPTP